MIGLRPRAPVKYSKQSRGQLVHSITKVQEVEAAQFKVLFQKIEEELWHLGQTRTV